MRMAKVERENGQAPVTAHASIGVVDGFTQLMESLMRETDWE